MKSALVSRTHRLVKVLRSWLREWIYVDEIIYKQHTVDLRLVKHPHGVKRGADDNRFKRRSKEGNVDGKHDLVFVTYMSMYVTSLIDSESHGFLATFFLVHQCWVT